MARAEQPIDTLTDVPDRYIREKARSSPTLQQLTDAGERGWWRLTTTCDDYGRFDADPEVLLSELMKRKPVGWTVRKMATVLEEWERVGLIHRYAIEGNGTREYAHVLTFTEHQRERDSKPKFPDPPCRNSPQLAAKCGESRLRVRAPAGAHASESESVSVSESVSESGERARALRAASPWPSPGALIGLYNAQSPEECPAVETLSEARRRKAQQYLAAFPDEGWWQEVFAQMRRSPFLRGRVKPRDDRAPFVADFDWLLTKGKDGTENVVKVHDGRYQDG